MLREVVEKVTLMSYNNSDELISSTTSLSYIDKVVLDVIPLFTGNYKLNWYCEISQSNLNARALTRVFDDTNIFGESITDFKVANIYKNISGYKIISLTKGVRVIFRLQFCASSQTVSIQRARLLLERLF